MTAKSFFYIEVYMWRISMVSALTISCMFSVFGIVECELKSAIESGDIQEVRKLLEKAKPLTAEEKQELIQLAQGQIDSKKPVSSWHLPVGIGLLAGTFISSIVSGFEGLSYSTEPKLSNNPFKYPRYKDLVLSEEVRRGLAQYEANVQASSKIAFRHQFILRTIIQIMGFYHVCKHFVQKNMSQEYNRALAVKEFIIAYKGDDKAAL
jgi:hypothetical protein